MNQLRSWVVSWGRFWKVFGVFLLVQLCWIPAMTVIPTLPTTTISLGFTSMFPTYVRARGEHPFLEVSRSNGLLEPYADCVMGFWLGDVQINYLLFWGPPALSLLFGAIAMWSRSFGAMVWHVAFHALVTVWNIFAAVFTIVYDSNPILGVIEYTYVLTWPMPLLTLRFVCVYFAVVSCWESMDDLTLSVGVRRVYFAFVFACEIPNLVFPILLLVKWGVKGELAKAEEVLQRRNLAAESV